MPRRNQSKAINKKQKQHGKLRRAASGFVRHAVDSCKNQKLAWLNTLLLWVVLFDLNRIHKQLADMAVFKAEAIYLINELTAQFVLMGVEFRSSVESILSIFTGGSSS